MTMLRCPSDEYRPDGNHTSSVTGDYSTSSYAPSQGSQSKAGGGCPQYDLSPLPNPAGNAGDWGWTPVRDEISGMFGYYPVGIRIQDATDGTSNVIAMGEIRAGCGGPAMYTYSGGAGGGGYGWLDPFGMAYTTTVPINHQTCPGEGPGVASGGGCNSALSQTAGYHFGSRHVGGAHFVLMDGAVRFLSQNIDFMTYNRLGDRRDGAVVGEF